MRQATLHCSRLSSPIWRPAPRHDHSLTVAAPIGAARVRVCEKIEPEKAPFYRGPKLRRLSTHPEYIFVMSQGKLKHARIATPLGARGVWSGR